MNFQTVISRPKYWWYVVAVNSKDFTYFTMNYYEYMYTFIGIKTSPKICSCYVPTGLVFILPTDVCETKSLLINLHDDQVV